MNELALTKQMEDDFNLIHNVRLRRLSVALDCDINLVDKVWKDLNLDRFDDPADLNDIRDAVASYDSAIKHVKRLIKLLEGLPVSEEERLLVARNDLIKTSVKTLRNLNDELVSLHAHRQSVLDRNPSAGGSDPRADLLAELVAVIFEKTNRKVAFGLLDKEPSTLFCKAVRDVLLISDNKRSVKNDNAKISSWRQPARKAFESRKLNTN
jgi:hypothetical protein